MYSIQHVLTPEIVKAGYRRIGQFPVSFVTTMSRCTRLISGREMDNMREQLAGMVDIFQRTGILTEDQMDAANIRSVNDEASNGRSKDDRPLHQQRSVIMNGVDCIEQYRSYINYRDGEPARRALAAEQREAARVVRERKAEEIRRKRDVKDAEKLRRANFTPAELKEESRLKRAATKAAKLAATVQELLQQQPPEPLLHDIDSEDEGDALFADDEIDDISANARQLFV